MVDLCAPSLGYEAALLTANAQIYAINTRYYSTSMQECLVWNRAVCRLVWARTCEVTGNGYLSNKQEGHLL